jgi:hypothetical protein
MMLSRWLTRFLPDTIEQRPRSSAFLKICVTPGAAIARRWYRRLRYSSRHLLNAAYFSHAVSDDVAFAASE